MKKHFSPFFSLHHLVLLETNSRFEIFFFFETLWNKTITIHDVILIFVQYTSKDNRLLQVKAGI